jgi:hypothetical protein
MSGHPEIRHAAGVAIFAGDHVTVNENDRTTLPSVADRQ